MTDRDVLVAMLKKAGYVQVFDNIFSAKHPAFSLHFDASYDALYATTRGDNTIGFLFDREGMVKDTVGWGD